MDRLEGVASTSGVKPPLNPALAELTRLLAELVVADALPEEIKSPHGANRRAKINMKGQSKNENLLQPLPAGMPDAARFRLSATARIQHAGKK